MTSTFEPHRRSVLIGAAASATAVGLAGCASSEPESDTSSAGSATSAGSGPASTTSGGANALAQTSAVPVGGAVYVAAQKVIITQPTSGTFKAFSSTCPHAGCAVSKIEAAKLICPCHGSTFDLNGEVSKGPATSGLTTENISVDGDSIVRR